MSDSKRKFLSLLEPVVQQTKLSLKRQQVEQLFRHYSLLTQWNQKFNLTAIRDSKKIVMRHFGESLFLAAKLPEAKTLVDIGSGAGFPGLPFAIVRPSTTVTLVESIRKKTVFLREVAREIGNVRILNARAEEVNESFEWAVCRAVSLPEILPAMRNLAANIALMASRTTALDLNGQWKSPIPIPWGDQRMLLMGHFCTKRFT